MTKALEEQIGRTCSVGCQDTAISTAVRLILLQELENRSKEVKEQKNMFLWTFGYKVGTAEQQGNVDLF